MLRLLTALVCSALAYASASEVIVSIGFHDRPPEHWAGAIQAAVIGVDGTENPLGDRTEPLPSTDDRLVTVGSQTSAWWLLDQPCVCIEVLEWFDARGPLEVQLRDSSNNTIAYLRQSGDSYMAEDGGSLIGSLRGIGQVVAQRRQGANAGGHCVLKCTLVDVHVTCTNNEACDGERGDRIHFQVNPPEYYSDVRGIDLLPFSQPLGYGSNNPSGQILDVRKDGNAGKRWKVMNARWYDNGTSNMVHPDCQFTAVWDLQPIYKINGSDRVYFGDHTTEADDYTVQAKERNGRLCMQGEGGLKGTPWTGKPKVTSQRNPDGTFSIVYERGSFKERREPKWSVTAPRHSQFRRFIVAEEKYHARKQHANFNHWLYGGIWRSIQVFQKAREEAAKHTFNEAWQAELQGAIIFELAKSRIFRDGNIKRDEFLCQLEREAKTKSRVPAPFHVECAYPDCAPSTTSN